MINENTIRKVNLYNLMLIIGEDLFDNWMKNYLDKVLKLNHKNFYTKLLIYKLKDFSDPRFKISFLYGLGVHL